MCARSRSANVRVLASSRHARHDPVVQATYLDHLLVHIEWLRAIRLMSHVETMRTYQVGHNNLGGLARGSSRRSPGCGLDRVRSDRGIRLLCSSSLRSFPNTARDSGSCSLSSTAVRARTGSNNLIKRMIEVGRHD